MYNLTSASLNKGGLVSATLFEWVRQIRESSVLGANLKCLLPKTSRLIDNNVQLLKTFIYIFCEFRCHKAISRGSVAQWVAHLTSNVEVVGSTPIKGPHCFLEQETLPLLLSTGLFQEWIRT